MKFSFSISILTLSLILLSFIPLIQAEEYGYNTLTLENILRNLNDVNIVSPAGQQVILYNQTSSKWYNSYLNDSAHSVNASDYWTTGDRGALRNVADIFTSWLTNNLFVERTGDTMSGNLNMGGNNITTSSIFIGNKGNLIHSPESRMDINTSGATRFYANVSNPGQIAYMFCAENPGGVCLPRFIIQRGGTDLGSILSRSLGIIGDDVGWLNGTDSNGIPTNLSGYLAYVGEEQKIDFATDVSGADVYIGDDLQVAGDFWFKDTDGEYHNANREGEIRDELYRNILETQINSSFDLSSGNLSIIQSDGKSLFVNINEVNHDLGISEDSIILTTGTNTTPIFNHVYYSNGGTPTLSKSTTPQSSVADVAQMILGSGMDYASIAGAATNDEFIRGVYNRFFDEGAVYKSGFDISVDSSDINISTGTVKVLLEDSNINQNHSTSNLVVEIHDDGGFHQHINNLSGFDTYSTGESVGVNKIFNLVCGIAITEDEAGVMYCVVQNKPVSEHSTAASAELDNTYINFFPNNDLVAKLYIPVVRVVVKNTPSAAIIQELSTGEFFFDLRGTVTGSGSAPSSGISALSQLNIDTNYEGGSFNTTNDWGFFENINVTGNYFGDGSQLTGISSGLWTNSSGNATFTTGNVGIGLTSASSPLHVAGTIQSNDLTIQGLTGANAIHKIQYESDQVLLAGETAGFQPGFLVVGSTFASVPGRVVFRHGDGGTRFEYANGANNTEQMRITPAGDLGVGTDTPSSKIHAIGDIQSNDLVINGETGADAVHDLFYETDQAFRVNEVGSFRPGFIVVGTTFSADPGRVVFRHGDGGTRFEYANGTENNELMRITSTGNVGIGTSAPQNSLDVSGGQVIGSSYAGVNTAPTDGLLVEGNVGIGTVSPATALEVSGGLISGGTNSATVANRATLDLAGSSSASTAAADFTFPDGGKFRTLEFNLAGTNDIFFQAAPPTTSGYGILEAWNSAGLIIGTGGNTNPITFKLNRVEAAELSSTGLSIVGDYTGGTFVSDPTHSVSLDLAASTSSSAAAAAFNFPDGGMFRAFELDIAGTNDIFFQALPPTTNGYGIVEAWASKGLILGTGGNANPIIFKTNRVEIGRFHTNGGFGIGTTSPQNKLDVSGAQVIGSSYAGVNTAPTDGLLVEGRVGIGTTTVSKALHIEGTGADSTIRIVETGSGDAAVEMFAGLPTTGTAWSFFADTSEDTFNIREVYNPSGTLVNTDRLIIDAVTGATTISGNTTIQGSAEIQGLLSLTPSSGNNILSYNPGVTSGLWLQNLGANTVSYLNMAPSGSATDSVIRLYTTSNLGSLTNAEYLAFGGGFGGAPSGTFSFGSLVHGNANANARDISFAISNAADGRIEAMRIKNTGNVGIGTSAPQNSLDVSGAQVIGSSYAGVNTAPTDGLLVEGDVGIGSTETGSDASLAEIYLGGDTWLGSGDDQSLFCSDDSWTNCLYITSATTGTSSVQLWTASTGIELDEATNSVSLTGGDFIVPNSLSNNIFTVNRTTNMTTIKDLNVLSGFTGYCVNTTYVSGIATGCND